MHMTTDVSVNNKRIAKNTLYLYLRQILILVVSLYTSRIVLATLGESDYGVYNVVGGVVSMFSIVTASLSQAISRYLTFELGKNDLSRLRNIFSTSINIQIIMSVIVLILMEIIGLWFLNYKMNIAENRMLAANWVFQISILTFIINLMNVPYNAVIIAHEKMKAFAYVSILEAVLKLILVACLLVSSIDKLITYAVLQFFVSAIIRIIYGCYCSRNFNECKYSFVIDKALLKDMTNFAGWNATSIIAYTLNIQGINILLNLFFGVTVNAARGIATQVEGIIKGFVLNFTTAVRPQIIKSYSSGDKAYLFKLLCSSTKYSYYLMLAFTLPFFLETETILRIWLGNYPAFAPIFIRLILLITLVATLGDLLYTNILAIGKLKRYMIEESCITILIFPLSYVMFKFKFPPETPYIFTAIVYFILTFIRLFFLKKEENFSPIFYMKKVISPVFFTTLIICIFLYFVKSEVQIEYSLLNSFFIIFLAELSLLICIYFIGIEPSEREFVYRKLKVFLKRHRTKS